MSLLAKEVLSTPTPDHHAHVGAPRQRGCKRSGGPTSPLDASTFSEIGARSFGKTGRVLETKRLSGCRSPARLSAHSTTQQLCERFIGRALCSQKEFKQDLARRGGQCLPTRDGLQARCGMRLTCPGSDRSPYDLRCAPTRPGPISPALRPKLAPWPTSGHACLSSAHVLGPGCPRACAGGKLNPGRAQQCRSLGLD
jgi:hypothetical protein